MKPGFTLVELMIVVAILGLLATIAIPHFARARTASQVRACIRNLSCIRGAKDQWALEQKKKDADVPLSADIVPYLRGEFLPPCPASGSYRMRRVIRDPVCSLYRSGHALSNFNMDDDPAAD